MNFIKNLFSKGLVRLPEKPLPKIIKRDIPPEEGIHRFTLKHFYGFTKRNIILANINVFDSFNLKIVGDKVFLIQNDNEIGWLKEESGWSDVNFIKIAIEDNINVEIVKVKRVFRMNRFLLEVDIRIPIF